MKRSAAAPQSKPPAIERNNTSEHARSLHIDAPCALRHSCFSCKGNTYKVFHKEPNLSVISFSSLGHDTTKIVETGIGSQTPTWVLNPSPQQHTVGPQPFQIIEVGPLLRLFVHSLSRGEVKRFTPALPHLHLC